eukprot:534571_1
MLYRKHIRRMAQVLLVLFAMIGIRSPQDIDCTNSRHCIDADIQATNTKSFGYKSTSGARTIITSTNATNCTGAFSCHGVSSISSATTRCHGTNACANIDSMVANRFECDASHSCAHSTLIGTRNKSQISCTGYKSCAHSHISSTEIIIASSTYALYNATIDSLHTIHDLHVTLSGYHAGLNANITCRANDICTINCHANACYRTYINCVGTCTINTQSIDTVYPITDVSNLIDTVINLRYEPLQTPLDNDELCSKSTAISYDHYPQRYDVPMNAHQTLCCRSHKSCNQSTILVSNATKSVVCSGSLACGDAMSLIKHPITSNGPIYCEGAASCAHAVLSTTDSVYCLGSESCGYGTVIQNALNVFCISYGSCSHAKIITSGSGHTHHVYYLGSASDNGNYGMFHCKTNDECIVSCGGRNSCSNLTLLCDGQCTVSCDSDTVCPIGYTNTQPLNPSTRRSLAEPLKVEVLHTCGEADPIGTYTEGDILTFTVTMPFDGELTFDARGSNFPVTTIEAFIGTGGILGTDTDHDEIMTFDVDAGEYKFSMIGTSASTPDIYHIVIHCVSAEPTPYPTRPPTSSPTTTASPSSTPSKGPTQDTTAAPSVVPTKHPSSNPSTPSPSMHPTVEPTIANPSVIANMPTNALVSETTADNHGSELVLAASLSAILYSLAGLCCSCGTVFVVWYVREFRKKRKETAADVSIKITGQSPLSSPRESQLYHNKTAAVSKDASESVVNIQMVTFETDHTTHANGGEEEKAEETDFDVDRDIVMAWLCYTVKLPQYIDLFLDQGYDNIRAVQTIKNTTHLSTLGVWLPGHQTIILAEISKLQSEYDIDFDRVRGRPTSGTLSRAEIDMAPLPFEAARQPQPPLGPYDAELPQSFQPGVGGGLGEESGSEDTGTSEGDGLFAEITEVPVQSRQ